MSWDDISYLCSKYTPQFLWGTLNTLILAIIGTLGGLLIGIFAGQARNIKVNKDDKWYVKGPKKALIWLTAVYVTLFRGTPMMVQGMVFFYVIPLIKFGDFQMDISAVTASGNWGYVFNGYMYLGLFVITINTGAYMTEIVKSGMNGVDSGQGEAARSLGLSSSETLWGVTLPQAIKNCLPTIGNEYVVNIKDSSVLNIIGVSELFYQAKNIAVLSYRILGAYMIIAFIYLFLTIIADWVIRLIDRKLKMPERRFVDIFFHYRPERLRAKETQAETTKAKAQEEEGKFIPVMNVGPDGDAKQQNF